MFPLLRDILSIVYAKENKLTMKKLDYEQIMYLYTNQEILNYSNRKRMAMKKIVNSIYDIYSEKLPKSFDGEDSDAQRPA